MQQLLASMALLAVIASHATAFSKIDLETVVQQKDGLDSDYCLLPSLQHGFVIVLRSLARNPVVGVSRVRPGTFIGIACNYRYRPLDPRMTEFECQADGQWSSHERLGCVEERKLRRATRFVHYTSKTAQEDFVDDAEVNYFAEDQEAEYRSAGSDQKLVDEFFAAIDQGDADRVRQMVKERHELLKNHDSARNRTAVMAAIEAGEVELLELFLNQGAPTDRDHSLLMAAKLGEARIVETLLFSGARKEIRDPELERTPLMWAAALGHTECVRILLEHDADVHSASDRGDFEKHDDGTAIHLAVVGGHMGAMDVLMKERPFLVEARNRFSETPLMSAAYNGHVGLVGRLIKRHRANTEARSLYGKTALMVAGNNDQLAVVQLLARNGANLTARSYNMRTALHQASDRHVTRVVHYLVAVDPSLLLEGDQRLNTPMHLAVEHRYLDYVDHFSQKNPDSVVHPGELGRTPVHWAARDGYLEALTMMVERVPAAVFARSGVEDGGELPIHSAVRGHQLQSVQRLLAANHLQLEATTEAGDFTPLELATTIGDAELACHFVSLAADTEARDQTGATPLIVAARMNHDEIVKCLLEGGANPMAQTDLKYLSQTALHAAAKNGSLEAIDTLIANSRQLLEARDALGRTALMTAAASNQFSAVDKLLSLGADREARTNKNETALWIAAATGNLKMLKHLAKHGCDLEAIGIYGRTPLLAASAAGNLPVVDYLIQRGVNWRAHSHSIDSENSALHLALYFKHQEVADYLRGAVPQLQQQTNYFGLTADQYVATRNNLEGPALRRVRYV